MYYRLITWNARGRHQQSFRTPRRMWEALEVSRLFRGVRWRVELPVV
jgi:hypothetical protein